jgi:hypothetical protein
MNLEYPKDREALADQFIQTLNDLLDDDRVAIEALIEHRVFCSDGVTNHPTVQVSTESEGVHTVGLLGILNGLVGIIEDGPRKGWGFITAVYDDDGKLVKFQRTANAD